MDDKQYENTDRELWREREGDFYADSIHVTKDGRIGINCGGTVRVMPIRKWFECASSAEQSAAQPVARPQPHECQPSLALRAWTALSEVEYENDPPKRILDLMYELQLVAQGITTPPAQPDTRRFNIGDRVRKIKGSQWQGRIVGTYSTSLTPEGYAVESEREPGSVQIYPVSALAAAPKEKD